MATAISLPLVTAALGAALTLTTWAEAQPSPPEPAQGREAPGDLSAPVLIPPRLIRFVEAAPPEGAPPHELVVPLTLAIDAGGRVTDAAILSPQGSAFEEAARLAALQFVFEPALQNGQPVAARIRFEYVFPPTAPAENEPERSAPTQSRESSTPGGIDKAERTRAPDQQPARRPPIEVTVQGKSEAERLRESSEAVQVIETERAQRESANLGEVLRRTQGVGLRTSGGLGSSTRFSLNGMTDGQIRFFMDGMPLELAGFGLGVSVVPVNLVERVELYRGVVPVRFGTDALGGVVNLVTDTGYRGTQAGASYQTGSFGTYRATAQVRHRFDESPFVVGASAFVDYAKNNYPIDIEIPDSLGRPQPATVYRLHDRYRASGANLELGVVDLPWAQRLLLRAYTSSFTKQRQHNSVMTVPYGEVESAERVDGLTLRYQEPLRVVRGLRLDALAGYARRRIDYRDKSEWSYNWFGRRIRRKLVAGEIGGADDSTFIEHRGLGRLGLVYLPASDHQLRLVSTLNTSSRDGENRAFRSDLYLDPATARQRLRTLVTGAEYELDALSDRLENVFFLKHYHHAVNAQQGGDNVRIDAGFTERSGSSGTFGAGDTLRFRFTDWLLAKVSYEHAVRLPTADQIFGDGQLTLPNYEIEPEISDNANLGLAVSDARIGAHSLRGEVNGFWRETDQLIWLLPVETDYFRNYNVWSSRSRGVELAAGWTSPGNYLWLDGNVTWLDLRNTSTRGSFADFNGDRIPNQPWLYANASARVQLSGLSAPNDELSLSFRSSYVREFFRSWESAGRREYKLVIDSQLLHSVALTYLVRSALTVSTTLEVENLTDARAYDFLGVQKPGRAFSFKGTVKY